MIGDNEAVVDPAHADNYDDKGGHPLSHSVDAVTLPELHLPPALTPKALFSPEAVISQFNELFGLAVEFRTGSLLPTQELSDARPTAEPQSLEAVEDQVPSSDGVGALEKTWLNLSPHTPK